MRARALLAVMLLLGCDDLEDVLGGDPPARVRGTLQPFAPGRTSAKPKAAPPPALVSALQARFGPEGTATAALRPAPRGLPTPGFEPGRDFVPGELLVSLREDGEEVLERLHGHPGLAGYRFEEGVWGGPEVLTLRVRDAARPERRIDHLETAKIAGLLSGHGGLRSANVLHYRAALRVPNDPLYGLQWHYEQIGLPAAWDVTTGSSSVVVAVIDDGVNRHDDLNDRVLPGYDMISDTRFSGDGDGRDPDPSQVPGSQSGQSIWHGVHVAGTIGATTGNDLGLAGVDWAARILPVRVLGVATEDGGAGTTIDVIAGIHWAVGVAVPGVPANPNPADVLNLSLGGGSLVQAEQDAIDAAVQRGAVVVVAAGNESADAGDTSLGGYDGVIVVGATDFQGRRAGYSNYGSAVDIMAPGGSVAHDANADGYPDGVLSTWLDSAGTRSEAYFLQGTSMAAPHVAGVVALMKAVRPSLTAAEAEEILERTADPSARCSLGCGAGLINAAAAVRAAQGGANTEPPQVALSASRVNAGTEAGAQLLIYNAGGGTLDFQAAVQGNAAVRISGPASGSLAAGASTALAVSIDRTGLADGNWQATLVVTSNGGEARAAILFVVGEQAGVDVGELTVATVILDARDELVVGGETRTGAAAGYAYTLVSEPGDWFVVALGDADGDGEIDLLGFWKSVDAIEAVTLRSGVELQGIDFVVPPYVLEHGTLPCGELRTCVEGCAGEDACIEACPVSAECQSCYEAEILPCENASGCGDDGACLCAACSAPYAVCFGPLSCGGGGGGGTAPLGAVCGDQSACAAPYACDTSVTGGYCTRDCLADNSCPGGTCVGFDEDEDGTVDSAFCLAPCTGAGTCPRTQDTCTPLDTGASACLP